MKAPTAAQISERVAEANNSLPEFAGKEFSTETFVAFCELAIKLCQPRSSAFTREQQGALERSLMHLYGHTHDLPLLKRNMHRVIANWHFIREGMEIPEWRGERIEGTALFIGVKRMPIGPGERPKYEVMLKLKSGIAAGIITCALLTEGNIYRFLEKASGTREYNCAPEEIAGMEAEVRVEVVNGTLRLLQWSCNQREKTKNKELAERRSDIRKCKKNIPCNTCRCTIYECPLAVWLPRERS